MLPTLSLQGVQQFYQTHLGFPVAKQSDTRISFQISQNFVLCFEKSISAHPQHFAFRVPPAHFRSAVAWLRSRTATLLQEDGDAEGISYFDLERTRPRQFYFRDCDGNILEIYAEDAPGAAIHPDLQITGLREIGLPHSGQAHVREVYARRLGWTVTPNANPGFNFVRSEHCVFVVVEEGRNWWPLDLPARKVPLRIELQGATALQEFEVDGQCIIVGF